MLKTPFYITKFIYGDGCIHTSRGIQGLWKCIKEHSSPCHMYHHHRVFFCSLFHLGRLKLRLSSTTNLKLTLPDLSVDPLSLRHCCHLAFLIFSFPFLALLCGCKQSCLCKLVPTDNEHHRKLSRFHSVNTNIFPVKEFPGPCPDKIHSSTKCKVMSNEPIQRKPMPKSLSFS